MIRYIGAALIILACGGCGFSMAAACRREENTLRQLLRALEYMSCELQYRQPPLAELCGGAAKISGGQTGRVFSRLEQNISHEDAPGVWICMEKAVSAFPDLPMSARRIFLELGQTLGQFDLPGQQKGFSLAMEQCRLVLEEMAQNRTGRLRSYQTLGLCAGAALVILFI